MRSRQESMDKTIGRKVCPHFGISRWTKALTAPIYTALHPTINRKPLLTYLLYLAIPSALRSQPVYTKV